MSDISEHHFTVGAMDYNVIIVPELETIRDTTLKRLERFADHGGCVIFLGSPPKYVDAAVNSRALELYKRVEQLPFNKLAVLNALKDVREVEIKDVSGTLTDDLIYQLREEEGCRWLFIAHAGKPINPDIPDGKIINIKVRGNWAVTIYDTLSGDIRSLAATVKNGWTEVSHPFYEHDSLLLKLVHSNVSANDTAITIVNHNEEGSCRFLSPVPVTLHEPNVLLLDMAEYALDDDPYRKQEEILRLDNILRRELSLPTREVAIVQPWVQNDTSILHVLKLRFTFESKVKIKGAELALENAAITEIMLNGQQAKCVSGWYVDKCIGKVPLPDIQIGRNVLE
jgi:hypothetical protein